MNSLRNFADNSISKYARAVRQYADYFGTSHDKLGEEHLREYLLYLRDQKKVAQGNYIQAVATIRLFYRVTLGRPTVVEDVYFSRSNKKLPVVLLNESVMYQDVNSRYKLCAITPEIEVHRIERHAILTLLMMRSY